jgi:hypothetical protein
MTGESVRDVGFLRWENERAWMEKMKGKRWSGLLRRERSYLYALTRPLYVKQHIHQFQKEFQQDVIPRLEPSGELLLNGVIYVSFHESEDYEWRWRWSTRKRRAISVETDGTRVWHTMEHPSDTYKTLTVCEDIDGNILWQRDDLGSDIVVSNGNCYFIKIRYPFDTLGAYVCDARTGKNEMKLIDGSDTTRFLSFITGANHSVFIQSTQWNESRTWRVDGRRVSRLYPETRFQYPYDYDNIKTITMDNKTVYHGPVFKRWSLPPSEYVIDWLNPKTGHVVTHRLSEQTIWICRTGEKPEIVLQTSAGEISAFDWPNWYGEVPQAFLVRTPEYSPQIIHVIDRHITTPLVTPKLTYMPRLTTSIHRAKSADGTVVDYMIVQSAGNKRPQKLLCYVYGAYGSPAVILWPHMIFGPLFSRGWAVAYSFPRGSGDKDIQWMLNGQAKKHLKTIEDFEAIVRHAQQILEIPPERTVIYGRSAGGLMVGGTTARNPDGKLMGATFTEVPFVDGVRSQTNPTLPLVQTGFSEYGNPIESVVNFKALFDISPMNSMPADGAPGVFVLCRTGLKDLQVLPYEPVKWVQKLRGTAKPPAGKFLAYEADEAHVYTTAKYYKARGHDLAILDLWAEGRLKVPKVLTRKNLRLRYTMAQQQQKKQQQKKQQQDGGKRRRTQRRRTQRRRTHRRR